MLAICWLLSRMYHIIYFYNFIKLFTRNSKIEYQQAKKSEEKNNGIIQEFSQKALYSRIITVQEILFE
jgi:hypothetical protein